MKADTLEGAALLPNCNYVNVIELGIRIIVMFSSKGDGCIRRETSTMSCKEDKY